MKRYQSLELTGAVIAQGNTIGSVDGSGDRILVDYKLRRFAVHGFYPLYRYVWHPGLDKVGDILRRS